MGTNYNVAALRERAAWTSSTTKVMLLRPFE